MVNRPNSDTLNTRHTVRKASRSRVLAYAHSHSNCLDQSVFSQQRERKTRARTTSGPGDRLTPNMAVFFFLAPSFLVVSQATAFCCNVLSNNVIIAAISHEIYLQYILLYWFQIGEWHCCSTPKQHYKSREGWVHVECDGSWWKGSSEALPQTECGGDWLSVMDNLCSASSSSSSSSLPPPEAVVLSCECQWLRCWIYMHRWLKYICCVHSHIQHERDSSRKADRSVHAVVWLHLQLTFSLSTSLISCWHLLESWEGTWSLTHK